MNLKDRNKFHGYIMNQDVNQCFFFFCGIDISIHRINPKRNINSTAHNLDNKSTGTIYFTTFLFKRHSSFIYNNNNILLVLTKHVS